MDNETDRVERGNVTECHGNDLTVARALNNNPTLLGFDVELKWFLGPAHIGSNGSWSDLILSGVYLPPRFCKRFSDGNCIVAGKGSKMLPMAWIEAYFSTDRKIPTVGTSAIDCTTT